MIQKRNFHLSFLYLDGLYIFQEPNQHHPFRSSRPDMFCKKGILRNFAKSTGKHLCQSLYFNKVAGHKPATLLKYRFWHRCFPVNFAKFLRTPFLTEHLRWLLLSFDPEFVSSVTLFSYSFIPKFATALSK